MGNYHHIIIIYRGDSMQDLVYEFYGIYPYFDYGFHFVDHLLHYVLFPFEDEEYLKILLEKVSFIEFRLKKSCFHIEKNKHGNYISNGYVLFSYTKNEVTTKEIFMMNQIIFDQEPFNLLEIRDKWVSKVDFFRRRYLHLLDLNHPCYEQYCIMTLFYLGQAETAIGYLIDVVYDHPNQILYGFVSHQRIQTIEFEELYNPLYFVKDNRVRDIIELYKKNMVHLDDIELFIKQYRLSNIEIHYMMARCLFPTFYFDYVEEDYFKEKTTNQEILDTYHKIELNLLRIKELYFLLNQYYPLRPINWLMKD